jgi:integrase
MGGKPFDFHTGGKVHGCTTEKKGNIKLLFNFHGALIGLQYHVGDNFAMSSRALTSDQIRRIYAHNAVEGRSTLQIVTPRKSRSKDPESWGSPRHRLLVHAVTTLAFTCLLRLDEALNLRFEDIEFHDDHAVVTLASRKTHQLGGSFSIRRVMFVFTNCA